MCVYNVIKHRNPWKLHETAMTWEPEANREDLSTAKLGAQGWGNPLGSRWVCLESPKNGDGAKGTWFWFRIKWLSIYEMFIGRFGFDINLSGYICMMKPYSAQSSGPQQKRISIGQVSIEIEHRALLRNVGWRVVDSVHDFVVRLDCNDLPSGNSKYSKYGTIHHF